MFGRPGRGREPCPRGLLHDGGTDESLGGGGVEGSGLVIAGRADVELVSVPHTVFKCDDGYV
jgi:hypothetical protein